WWSAWPYGLGAAGFKQHACHAGEAFILSFEADELDPQRNAFRDQQRQAEARCADCRRCIVVPGGAAARLTLLARTDMREADEPVDLAFECAMAVAQVITPA